LNSAKKSLDEKDILLNKYKSSTDNFRKLFICIFKKLSQFSHVLSSFKETKYSIHIEYSDIISQISKDSEGILNMLPKFFEGFDSTGVQEEVLNSLNSFMESIENKITILITNLLNTKVKKNEISKLIDGVINEEKIEFLNKEIIEENKSLRILLDNNTYLLENVIKNPDLNLFEELKIINKKQNEEIYDLNKQLEEMKASTKSIRQKLASSPYLPFIIVKDIDTVKIKQHNCLCFYCGFDLIKEKENEENGSKSSKNIGIISFTNNNNTQIINGINNNPLKPQSQSHSSINFNHSHSHIQLQENKALKDIEEIENKNKIYLNSTSNPNSNFISQDLDMIDSSNTNLNNKNNLKVSDSDINNNCNDNINHCDLLDNQKKEKGDEKLEKSNTIRSLFLDPIQESDYFLKKKGKDSEKHLSLNEEKDMEIETEKEAKVGGSKGEKEKFNNQISISKSPKINQTASDNQNIQNTQNIQNIQSKQNSSFSNNSPENENNLIDEENKQNLEVLYKKLYTSYLNLKFEKNISYQGLIKSKPFQVLLGQIESCINTIDNQKTEIIHMKKHLSEVHNQISSQEKFYKFDKMKDLNLLEEKVEKIQKDYSLKENEIQKMQIEINKLEEFIKTIRNFDYSQLTSIDEFYKNRNVELIEMLKSQAKINTEKYQIEYEKCEIFEKANLKLQMELDRFKTALSKYENVEGVESN